MEKMRWGWCGDGVGVQWSRFQRLRTGITWLPVLRAASRVSGPASENRCPRACDSTPPFHSHLDKIDYFMSMPIATTQKIDKLITWHQVCFSALAQHCEVPSIPSQIHP